MAHSSKRWSMSKTQVRIFGLALALVPLAVHSADNARQIVEEAQKRTDAKSHRYEGLLQVFDTKGNIGDKRWSFERLGSHGSSKAVLRSTAPAEVKTGEWSSTSTTVTVKAFSKVRPPLSVARTRRL